MPVCTRELPCCKKFTGERTRRKKMLPILAMIILYPVSKERVQQRDGRLSFIKWVSSTTAFFLEPASSNASGKGKKYFNFLRQMQYTKTKRGALSRLLKSTIPRSGRLLQCEAGYHIKSSSDDTITGSKGGTEIGTLLQSKSRPLIIISFQITTGILHFFLCC